MRRVALALILFLALASATAACASDKADIDTSPRVFASASGKYWVRVTTRREMAEVNRWTTTLTLYHADGGNKGYADEKVVSETALDNFPARILVSDKGHMTTLGHFGSVSLEGVITVYGPDGKKRGSTEFIEFLQPLAGGGSGSPRAIGHEMLREGKGATYDFYRTPEWLILPLGNDRVARLNLQNGRPAE